MKMFLLLSILSLMQSVNAAPTNDGGQVPNPFCTPCQMALKVVSQYPEPVEKLFSLPCRLSAADNSCKDDLKAFLSSLKEDGEIAMCKKHKFCGKEDLAQTQTVQSQSFQLPGFPPIQLPFQLPTINGLSLPGSPQLSSLPLPRLPGLPQLTINGGNEQETSEESEKDSEGAKGKSDLKKTSSERRPKPAQFSLFSNPFDNMFKNLLG